jgi:hypothetical protein
LRRSGVGCLKDMRECNLPWLHFPGCIVRVHYCVACRVVACPGATSCCHTSPSFNSAHIPGARFARGSRREGGLLAARALYGRLLKTCYIAWQARQHFRYRAVRCLPHPWLGPGQALGSLVFATNLVSSCRLHATLAEFVPTVRRCSLRRSEMRKLSNRGEQD